jgi:hypothetical protein
MTKDNFTFCGNVSVITTNNRGKTVEEIAEYAIEKIMYIGDKSPQYIRDQAYTYKKEIKELLICYMKEAIKSDRKKIAILLENAGYSELIKLLEEK